MGEMSFMENAVAYAARHQSKLAERLGFGIHGIIHVAENKFRGGKTAIKAHRETDLICGSARFMSDYRRRAWPKSSDSTSRN